MAKAQTFKTRTFEGIHDPALPPYVRRLTPTKREKWIAEWNAAYSSCKVADKANCEGQAFKKANGAVFNANHAVRRQKMSDTAQALTFADRTLLGIDPNGDLVASAEAFRLFMDTPSLVFADAGTEHDPNDAKAGVAASPKPLPEWISYLPIPSVHQHPRYGKIEMTLERNKQFVQNFKDGVWQDRLPIDAEHEYKLSGAMGWIVDMRLTEKGGVEAKVEWTDQGEKMLRANRFRYFSPEFYPKWLRPADSAVIDNVAVGGALTTKPFFKAPYLDQLPLVASENGHLALIPMNEVASSGIMSTMINNLRASTVVVRRSEGANTMDGVLTELTAEKYAEMQVAISSIPQLTQQITTLTTQVQTFGEQLSAAQAEIATKDAELLAAAAALAEIKNAALTEKFSTAFANVANKDAKVATAMTLAQTFGEDSDPVKAYVAAEQAAVQALTGSVAFREIGQPTTPATGSDSASAEIMRRAQTMSEAQGISKGEAMTQLMRSEPTLYQRYKDEKGF